VFAHLELKEAPLGEKLAYRAIDADNHYYEVDDAFSRNIDPAFRDRALHLVDGGGAARKWISGDQLVSFMPFNSRDQTVAPGALEKFFTGDQTKGTLSPEDFIHPIDHPALWERSARLELIDRQGLEAILQLPTLAVLIEPDLEDLPDVLTANLRAFNRWLEDDWGYGQDGRIFGVPVVTLVDADWPIDELNRTRAAGARFFCLRPGPVNGRSPADPSFDPFWACAQELGMRAIFHVGNAGFAKTFGTHWGDPADRPLIKYSAFQQYSCVVERPISETLANLILNNLFGRFPDLEVLSLEHGSSWVPGLCKGMDKAAKMAAGGTWPGGKLTDLPSEIFRRHVYVAPFHEDDIPLLVSHIGAERVLFGSDFPHAEGIAEPLDFASRLGDLDDKAVRRIMRDNAAGLLELESG